MFRTPIGKQTPQRQLKRAAKRHGREAQRQARKLPRQPLPYVPLLRHYTPTQRKTAKRIYERGIKRTAKRVGVNAGELSRQIVADPDARTRERLLPFARAAKQDRDVRDAATFMGLAKPGYKRKDYERAAEGQKLPETRRQATAWRDIDPSKDDTLKPAQGRSAATRAFDKADTAISTSLAPTGVLRTPWDVVATLATSGEAWKKTLKDAALLPVSLPAGVAQAVMHPKETVKQAGKDYKRRYKPLLEGHPEVFRERLRKEGVLPEVLDVATIAVPQGAIAGRTAGAVARSGGLGRTLERVATEPRPKLRTTGGVAREQDVSRNLFRAAVQRGEDRTRARRVERRNARTPDEKPGLQPGRGEVAPLFEKRAQRVETSRTQSRHFQRFKGEQGAEVDRGVLRNLGKLSKRQRDAVWHVVQGIVTPDDPKAAIAQLTRRRQKIVKEYRARGFAGEPMEARVIDKLIAHADEIFTPKMRALQEAELERGHRVGHTGVVDTTAEARRYRPQGEELGIPYSYQEARREIEDLGKRKLAAAEDANAAAVVKRERDEALAELERRRPELDRAYVEKVRVAAEAEGLPEPAYVQHFKHRQETRGRSARALGGRRAAPGPKESQMDLFRTGRAVTDPEAYVQSVSRSIKRRHNWRLVADQSDAHSFPNPHPDELREVFGHKHVNPEQLTADNWRDVLTARGLDHNDYAFWAPGRFDRELRDHASGDQHHHAGREETIDGQELKAAVEESLVPYAERGKLAQESGVRLIPRAVFDEIHSVVKTSTPGRVADKLQGLQSTVLLGTNPTWLAMQVAANTFLAGVGARGNVAAFVKSPLFWRKVPPEVKQAADDLFGTGIGESHGRRVHLGAATNSRMVDGYRAMREALGFKAAAARNAVPLLRNLPSGNPIQLMFAMDNAQNRYFKRVLLYKEAKRQAFTDMAREGAEAYALQERVTHMLDLGPRERMEAMIKDPALLERHAEKVNNVLGDYVRYTARERGTLKRYVLFYGFMRYSLRTLFYTLPVKHPITASIGAKLAQLHTQEVRELLGGDETPWAFGKLFTNKDPKNPMAIDLGRLNPLTNPAVEALTEGPRGLALGLFSPAFQIALNQAYGVDLFTQQKFRVNQSSAEGDLRNQDRLQIMLKDALELAFPVRAAAGVVQRGRQSDDVLPWQNRPIKYKSEDAKKRQQKRVEREGSPLEELKRQLVPFIPRPDTSKETAESIRERKAPAKKKGRKKKAPKFGGATGGGGGSGNF